ncbi:KfrB domain-containing protein [Burkholderia aenigmatica]|uniref:KfrB domain-containing protein n=1 Tax=Burkholderia aenigmatica TaxID=2015348 RepID=UPI00264ACF9E|nr:hypothetical protein [Burkholderia aenigmatica]MDN7880059.1 hypothetical protein [Burkholderia aenigmatica]
MSNEAPRVADHETFNTSLHKRIDAGIQQGTIRVAAGEVPAEADPLVGLLVANRRNERPLLDGAKVYRGSKDPDVDAAPFDAAFKNATSRLDAALQQTQIANKHIGVASMATRGIGVLAEYDLARDAVFHRNVAAPTAGEYGKSASGLTVEAAQERLSPLVDAVVAAQTPDEARQATDVLSAFCERELHSLALPVEHEPVRQWVVQQSGSEVRFLAHQDRGPLADVMIDVALARKSGIDAYSASKVSDDLRARSAQTAIQSFVPDAATAIKKTAEAVDTTLKAVHADTFGASHESLSEVLRWRRENRRSMPLSTQGSAGSSIESTDPKLVDLPLVRDAMDDVVHASTALQLLPQQEELRTVFDQACTASEAIERQKVDYEVTAVREREAADALRACVDVRNQAADALADAQDRHARALDTGVAGRVLYRLGKQGQAQQEIRNRQEHVAGLNSTLKKLTAEDEIARHQGDLQRARIDGISDRLSTYEETLQDRSRRGDAAFLTPEQQQKVSGLSRSDWRGLRESADVAIAASKATIQRGRDSATLFSDVSERGLSQGVEHFRTRKVTSANNSVQVAVRSGDEWLNVRVLDGGLAKGIYYLDDAVDPTKNVHPQKFGGEVIHSDSKHVFQLSQNGIVKHDASMFAGKVKMGQRYEVSYFRGVGRVVGEIQQDRSTELESRRGVRM